MHRATASLLTHFPPEKIRPRTQRRALVHAEGSRLPDPLSMYSQGHMDALFEAVIDATEESILNALLAAETMTGRGGNTVQALSSELLLEALV